MRTGRIPFKFDLTELLYKLHRASLGIRQFLTFEERLRAARESGGPEIREAYFDGLELLRGHLSRCLSQVAVLAAMELPADGVISHYKGEWEIKAYVPPKLTIEKVHKAR